MEGLYLQISEQPKNIFYGPEMRITCVGESMYDYRWFLSNARTEWRTRSQQLELISASWRGTGHLCLGCSSILVFPGLKGFLGHGTENAETGVLLNKLECLVTLRLTIHNRMHLPVWDKGISGEAFRRDPTGELGKCPWRKDSLVNVLIIMNLDWCHQWIFL